MGSRDFYTDAEIAGMEAADEWRPRLEAKEREIRRLERKVKKLEDERDRLMLKLDDALDASGA